jgi:hypothetical protein
LYLYKIDVVLILFWCLAICSNNHALVCTSKIGGSVLGEVVLLNGMKLISFGSSA